MRSIAISTIGVETADDAIDIGTMRDPEERKRCVLDQTQGRGADLVIEATGKFKTADDIEPHFERGARKLGLHPFPAPMAIASMPYKGRAACVQCGLCNGFGCEVMAKSSSVWTVIPEAEATGKCEVRAESYVFRIGMNASGRATGVHYFDAAKKAVTSRTKAIIPVHFAGLPVPRGRLADFASEVL